MGVFRLPQESHKEAENSFVVGILGEYRECKVECKRRSISHSGNLNTESEAGSHPESFSIDFHLFFDGSKVAKYDAFEHVICRQRKQVFDRINPHELSANSNSTLDRGGSSEVKSSKRGKAASKIVLENGRLRSSHAKLSAVHQRVTS